ncbi:hypothetical protein PO909_033424 [Leuciscus waleckii]
MEKIFKTLKMYRLEDYYRKFIDLGIKEELDFVDSVNNETLKDMNFSQTERNRYDNMLAYLKRIGNAPGMPVMKSLTSFHVSYRFPKCPEIQEITDLDPSQNTVEDLMLRICHENKDNMSVCLYTVDGMPLTDDPFFNTWSLKDRHIENGSELYAIFTPSENLVCPTQRKTETDITIKNEGSSVIRCHIMLQADFEIKVDFESDTLKEVTLRLSLESGIPARVLHIRGEEYNYIDNLNKIGITEDSVLQFSLSSFDDEKPSPNLFFQNDVKPSVRQTNKGLSVFLSTLYAIIAVVEGLYFLFRELLPGLNERSGPKTIEDGDVFEYANICWAYLITQGQNESNDLENYATVSLKAYATGKRLSEPVRVPGIPDVFEKSYIVEKITGKM